MLKKLKNKGIALFVTLALLLLLSMAVAVFLITSYNSANINESLYRRERALVVAEAGLNYAYWKIRIDRDDAGGPMSDYFPGTCTLTPPISIPTGWTLQVDVEDTGTGRKTVSSTVNYPKSTVF